MQTKVPWTTLKSATALLIPQASGFTRQKFFLTVPLDREAQFPIDAWFQQSGR